MYRPDHRCNQQRLSPPYVILALGDPARLSEAIEHDQTHFRWMPGIDLVVKVQNPIGLSSAYANRIILINILTC